MKYSELNEKKAHGSRAFPIESYQLDASHRQYVMPAHWHTEWEIIRVTSGRFALTLNKRSYLMEPGDLAFVNPGTVHHGKPEDCRYECIVFKPDMLLQSSGSAINPYIKSIIALRHTLPDYIPASSLPAVWQEVDRLISLLAAPREGYELAVYASLYSILYHLYEAGRIQQTVVRRSQEKQLAQLMQILEWIEDHYTERITLSDLSRAFGMNEKYLCHFFRAYTSYPPIEYVIRLRIEKAADDLLHHGRSVTEAAFANGFNDSAYFSKCFLRIKGCTPRQYRKSTAE